MSLLDGLSEIGKLAAHGLTVVIGGKDGGGDSRIECSDILVGALAAGILAVIGGTVYLHGDKFEKWIKAYKEQNNTQTVDPDDFKKWFKKQQPNL